MKTLQSRLPFFFSPQIRPSLFITDVTLYLIESNLEINMDSLPEYFPDTNKIYDRITV